MKFTRIDLARLRNEEWFQFMTETKDIIKSDNKTYGDVSEFMVKFEELLSQADAILQQLRKSDYTAQMQQTDYERDEVYRSLKYQVLSFAHHYEQGKREAGEKLEYVFETYGNIPAMSYSQQTASIYNLIQDLQTKFSNEVSLLALLPWVDKLHEKNEAFEKETMSRNDEYAGKLDVSMSDVRKQLNRVYLDVIEGFEFLSKKSGDDAYHGYLEKLNENIIRYQKLLARRFNDDDADQTTDLPESI